MSMDYNVQNEHNGNGNGKSKKEQAITHLKFGGFYIPIGMVASGLILIGTYKTTFDQHGKDIAEYKPKVAELITDTECMKRDIAGLNNGVNDVKAGITRIENLILNKLK